MSGDNVLLIEDLRFGWPGAASLCIDVSRFETGSGEHIFLHGPSGSGKSTLLGLLGGVLAPDEGRLRLIGEDLASMAPAARDRFRADHIGYIFQQFNLIPYLTVTENVLLPCRFSKRRRERASDGGSTPDSEAMRLLEHLGMGSDLRHREVTRLSVGQQQRVAAARALIGRPEIIIADEPTSALDAGLQTAFIALLLREAAAASATVVFVSHDRRLAAGFAREVALPSINRVPPAAEPQ